MVAFCRERVAPRKPVEFGGVDERPVEIPEYGTRGHTLIASLKREKGEGKRDKSPWYRNRMEHRQLGRTDMKVSAIGFGAWAIGGSWGAVDDEESMRALHAAVDAGVNFIDTADVYGDGRSERLVARLRRERPGETIRVATKAGRRLPQQTCEGYSRANLTEWIDRSLQNLDMDAIDLLQLHCPPSALYQQDDVFGLLEGFVSAGKLRYYGVSVETVDEALASMRYPGVQIDSDHLQHVPDEAR